MIDSDILPPFLSDRFSLFFSFMWRDKTRTNSREPTDWRCFILFSQTNVEGTSKMITGGVATRVPYIIGQKIRAPYLKARGVMLVLGQYYCGDQ